MAAQGHRPSVNGTMPRKAPAQKAPAKKPNTGAARAAQSTASRAAPQKAKPVANKAYSVAGEMPPASAPSSAYAIMASRIANRVAEMAESYTFVERPKSQPQQAAPEPTPEDKKKPRKLEMRLGQNGAGGGESVSFSAPFLDNTLQKMLQLQNRMLTTTAELSKSEGVEEKTIKEHASQSAELSRIIAMICAEKARQGA